MNHLLSIILQAPESIWTKLADHGATVLLLAVAVIVLWKRDQEALKRHEAMNEKMNNYLDEDRKEMIEVIKNNTDAFRNFSETLKVMMEK